MLREIFLPFERVFDQNESNSSQGSGLRLAIAERAVRMHEGRISARNAVDGGLIVEMELPIV